MTENISAQLFWLLKGKEFAPPLDEATDSNKDANLICYVRFVNEGSYVEDILFCKQTEEATAGHDLFKILDNFITLHEIDWENYVGVFTDGVSFMASQTRDFKLASEQRRPMQFGRIAWSMEKL